MKNQKANLKHRSTTQIVTDSNSPRSVFNSVVAGYLAGVSGTLAGHPMDSAKVWIQTGRRASISSKANTGSRNMSTVAAEVSKETILQRIRALYSGMTGPLLTVGFIQSLNFAVYDTSRRTLYGMEHGPTDDSMEYLNNDSMQNIALASVAAGTVLSFFTSPLQIIKTQQQTTGISFRAACSDAFAKPFVSGSRFPFKHLYSGFGPHFVCETFNRAVYFCTYESIKRGMSKDGDASLSTRMIAACAAGTTCWLSIFPLDAVRSRIFSQPYTEASSGSQMVTDMWKREGVRSFFKGAPITLIRAGPVAACILPVYDYALEYLSKMNN